MTSRISLLPLLIVGQLALAPTPVHANWSLDNSTPITTGGTGRHVVREAAEDQFSVLFPAPSSGGQEDESGGSTPTPTCTAVFFRITCK